MRSGKWFMALGLGMVGIGGTVGLLSSGAPWWAILVGVGLVVIWLTVVLADF